MDVLSIYFLVFILFLFNKVILKVFRSLQCKS